MCKTHKSRSVSADAFASRKSFKNASILRDYLNFWTWQRQKRSNPARIPQFSNLTASKTKLSWRLRTHRICDFSVHVSKVLRFCLLCARSSWKLRSWKDMGLNISSILTVDRKVTIWLHYAGPNWTKSLSQNLPNLSCHFLRGLPGFCFGDLRKLFCQLLCGHYAKIVRGHPGCLANFAAQVVLSDSQLFCPVVHVVTTQCIVFFVAHSRHGVTPILIWSANPTHHWSQHLFLYNVQTGQCGLRQWHSEEAEKNRRGDDWIKQPQAQLDGDVFVCKDMPEMIKFGPCKLHTLLETNVHTFRQVTCVLATQIFVRSIGGQYIQCFTIDGDKLRNTVGTGCQEFRFGPVQVQTHLCQFFT